VVPPIAGRGFEKRVRDAVAARDNGFYLPSEFP